MCFLCYRDINLLILLQKCQYCPMPMLFDNNNNANVKGSLILRGDNFQITDKNIEISQDLVEREFTFDAFSVSQTWNCSSGKITLLLQKFILYFFNLFLSQSSQHFCYATSFLHTLTILNPLFGYFYDKWFWWCMCCAVAQKW